MQSATPGGVRRQWACAQAAAPGGGQWCQAQLACGRRPGSGRRCGRVQQPDLEASRHA